MKFMIDDYCLEIDKNGGVEMTKITTGENTTCKDFEDLWACLTTHRTEL